MDYITITILAVIFLWNLVLSIFLIREKRCRKLSDETLRAEIISLAKDIAKRIIQDKGFESVWRKTISKETKALVSPSIRRLVSFNSRRSISALIEHIRRFDVSSLVREYEQEAEKVFPSNQNDQEEKKEESQEKG